jgi:NAD(P)H-hydrate epimerase
MKLIAKATSVALGPGLGLSDEVASFARAMITHCPIPLVIDADALTFLANESDQGSRLIKNRKGATILTPHPGEMGRLLGIETSVIQADRRGAIKKAVEKYDCVVLLKGARTLTSDSSGTTYVNLSGNSGMSTGGSGDALTGIIAGLLAQGLDALPAAATAAYIHGLAGDIVKTKNRGAIGQNAVDLIASLPNAIAHCQCVQ